MSIQIWDVYHVESFAFVSHAKTKNEPKKQKTKLDYQCCQF